MNKGGVGSGDVRLAPVLAMFLGWMGWSYVYIGLASGFILGGIDWRAHLGGLIGGYLATTVLLRITRL